MTQKKILFGFHAIAARLRRDASSIESIYFDGARRDKRMQDFLQQAELQKVKLVSSDRQRLQDLAASERHQGLVASASSLPLIDDLDELLDSLKKDALLLILDGVTDPHNLGACLRVADGAGVDAVIAPRDKAVRLNATVSKVSSGASENIPYIMVTNLARTLRELKDRDIRVIGTTDDASEGLYEKNLTGPLALVMGAEGLGMRRLTRETCDELLYIPMLGSVSSLNVSVASAICLYEAVRQRSHFD